MKTSALGASYSIGRIAERCAHTGEELRPGDAVVTALVERPGAEDLERIDLSLRAWEGGHRPNGLFAWWRGLVPERDARPRDLIDTSSLLGLFDSLEEAEEPRRVAFRYAVALMLIRKRQLELLRTRAAEGDTPAALIVRVRGGDQPESEVIDPGLTPEIAAAAVEQLGSVLGIGA